MSTLELVRKYHAISGVKKLPLDLNKNGDVNQYHLPEEIVHTSVTSLYEEFKKVCLSFGIAVPDELDFFTIPEKHCTITTLPDEQNNFFGYSVSSRYFTFITVDLADIASALACNEYTLVSIADILNIPQDEIVKEIHNSKMNNSTTLEGLEAILRDHAEKFSDDTFKHYIGNVEEL